MPKHPVIFDDSFFDSLSNQVPAERDGHGWPSFTDVLADEVIPLLELLAEDYEHDTMPVPDGDLFRVLVQPGLLVQHISHYTYDSTTRSTSSTSRSSTSRLNRSTTRTTTNRARHIPPQRSKLA